MPVLPIHRSAPRSICRLSDRLSNNFAKHWPECRGKAACLGDVRAGQQQVAGAEVADGAAVGHAARPHAQAADALRGVLRRPVTCD